MLKGEPVVLVLRNLLLVSILILFMSPVFLTLILAINYKSSFLSLMNLHE